MKINFRSKRSGCTIVFLLKSQALGCGIPDELRALRRAKEDRLLKMPLSPTLLVVLVKDMASL